MNSRHMGKVRYEDVEAQLRTGDVLLFHGDSRRSRVVETISGSTFSHIGMVVRLEQKPPLIWHTDPRPVAEDVLDRQDHGGAQLNDLATALAKMTSPAYGDTPWLRQLLVARTPALDDAALLAVTDMDERSFPAPIRVFVDWLLGHLRTPTPGKRMDCAEVVAEAYQRMGLLPAIPPANAYAPKDFSAENEKLGLLLGASLGPQLELLCGP